MQEVYTAISITSLILTICSILGGILAFRNGIARTANEVQERVINALEVELDNMRKRLDDLKDENTRLRLIIDTICAALKSRGMIIAIDGDMVSIHDGSGSTTTRIHEELP
jgi:hypothetical protein